PAGSRWRREGGMRTRVSIWFSWFFALMVGQSPSLKRTSQEVQDKESSFFSRYLPREGSRFCPARARGLNGRSDYCIDGPAAGQPCRKNSCNQSLGPERHHGIDPRRLARGQPARQQGNHEKQKGNHGGGHRIGGRDVIEEVLEDAGQRERRDQADRNACQ